MRLRELSGPPFSCQFFFAPETRKIRSKGGTQSRLIALYKNEPTRHRTRTPKKTKEQKKIRKNNLMQSLYTLPTPQSRGTAWRCLLAYRYGIIIIYVLIMAYVNIIIVLPTSRITSGLP